MVTLSGVTIERRITDERSLDLKRSLFDMIRGRYRAPTYHKILDGVTLQVDKGERLGVIGANGAGKSTLLRVIAGILTPTTGEAFTSGTVAPLIELTAGFDPDLSVLDNIILYGVLLGFSRAHMADRAEAILAFADLAGRARTLVKTLSSGMMMRLGFAIATDVKPDVLLLDEIFAVGDEGFRKKSRARIEELWSGGTATVIASHDLDLIVETCDRVVCLVDGRPAFIGRPRPVVRFYIDAVGAN